MERYGRANAAMNNILDIKKQENNTSASKDLDANDDSRSSISESISKSMTSRALVKSGRTVFSGANSPDFYQSKYTSSSFILTPSCNIYE